MAKIYRDRLGGTGTIEGGEFVAYTSQKQADAAVPAPQRPKLLVEGSTARIIDDENQDEDPALDEDQADVDPSKDANPVPEVVTSDEPEKEPTPTTSTTSTRRGRQAAAEKPDPSE